MIANPGGNEAWSRRPWGPARAKLWNPFPLTEAWRTGRIERKLRRECGCSGHPGASVLYGRADHARGGPARLVTSPPFGHAT